MVQSPKKRTAALGTHPHLEYVCVGAGRDGSASLAKMIHDLFNHEGKHRSEHHEYANPKFYKNFCDYAESNSYSSAATIDELIRTCPVNCIVGNGYGFILDRFAALYSGIKLLHIKRRSMMDCVTSLVKDARDFPQSYRYYVADDPSFTKRIAAFHFREMSRARWDKLAIEQKFVWYYKKTHSLIEKHKHLFSDYMLIYTEDLSASSTRRKIAKFIECDDGYLPPAIHINKNADGIDGLKDSERAMLQWYFRQLDYHNIAQGPHALAAQVIGYLTRWLHYQSDDKASEELYWAEKVDEERLRSILSNTEQLLEQNLLDVHAMSSKAGGSTRGVPLSSAEIDRFGTELALRNAEVERLNLESATHAGEKVRFQEELARRVAAIQQMEGWINEYKSENERLRAELSKRQTDSEELRKSLAQRISEVEQGQAKSAQQAREISRLQGEVPRYTAEIGQLRAELSCTQAEREQFKKNLALRSSELELIHTEIAPLEAKLAQSTVEAENLQQRLSLHSIEVERMQKEALLHLSANADLHNELRHRKAAYQLLSEEATQSSNECERLTKEHSKLLAELADRTAAVERLEWHLARRSGEVADLTAEQERIRSQMAERGSQLDRALGELAERTADHDRLALRLEQRAAEINDYSGEIAQLTSALNTEKTQSNHIQSDIARLTSELEQRAAEINDYSGEIAQLTSALNTEKTQSNHLRSDIARLTSELNRLQSEIRDSAGAVARLDAELTQRIELIQSFRQSTSWRITAPLRGIKLFLTGSSDKSS
jgi:predicted  nucleic acid-binding Zn-ribbon protein